MDRADLAARIQEILKGRPSPPRPGVQAPAGGGPADTEPAAGANGGDRVRLVHDEEAAFAARCSADEAASRVLEVLGAVLEHGPGGPCLVVERDYEGHRAHGRRRLCEYAGVMSAPPAALDLLSPGARGTPLFFDLETTGLSGGAGTYAFLVGCGYFDGDGFHTRQFFLRDFGAERALLHAVTSYVQGFAGSARAGTPVNGPPRDTRDPLATGHCPLIRPRSTAHCPLFLRPRRPSSRAAKPRVTRVIHRPLSTAHCPLSSPTTANPSTCR